MCDAFLVLAQAPAGLSVLLPAALCCPTARVNAMRIQRLKDKLGNKANASSEVEFDATPAPGWSARRAAAFRRSSRWARMTRLDCALGTSGLMRQALALALHHTRAAQRLRQARWSSSR